MDTTAIVILAIIALVVVGSFFVYRRRTSVDIKGPLGTGLKLNASDEATPGPPGVKMEDVESRKGGVLAEDKTGRGVDMKGVKADQDVLATSEGESPDPKE